MKSLNCLLTVFASSVALYLGWALPDKFQESHSDHYLLANNVTGVVKDLFQDGPRSRTAGASRVVTQQQNVDLDFGRPRSRTAEASRVAR